MNCQSTQKLVVVLGAADPVLDSTLAFIGLHVVHTSEDITVWAPVEWDLAWRAPAQGSHLWPASLAWDDIQWDGSDLPCELFQEVGRG